MKKLITTLRNIPIYGYIVGVILFGFQYGIYRFAVLLTQWTGTIDSAFAPKIPFDNLIPLVPAFVIIYLFSYLFWIIGFIVPSKTEKDNYINFIFTVVVSLFVGFLILWLAPTKIDRTAEGLIDFANSDKPFAFLLKNVYEADGGLVGWNLFPSYHCMISLACFLGVFRRKEIHIWFRIYSLIMVILISMSTVFTKQHYFVDIIGGYVIDIIVYLFVCWINPGKKILTHKQKMNVKDINL